MRKNIFKLVFIFIIIALAVVVDLPNGPNIKIRSYEKEIKVHRGLDLAGGSRLVYDLDTSKVDPKEREGAVIGVKRIIENRVNSLGVAEPVIQVAKITGKDAIVVELPGISDVKQATELIGKTAQLEFWESFDSAQDKPGQESTAFQPTGLTGKHLVRAQVDFQQGQVTSATGLGSEPIVSLQFNGEGTRLFREITQRNLGKPVAIVLDQAIISAPVVQSVIENGQAIISGDFDIATAKLLVIQLNSGALPVPATLVGERTIGPTLGRSSVEKSLLAGLVAVAVVALFMVSYYRLNGLVAVLALGCYVLIVLALFKLIPITLTLAGIAGFILTIGAAVDANILIFERMKEERRAGKGSAAVLDEGFRRAWSSIRDSNVSSLITAAILFYFGTGLVRGFALTLAIGILVSMFTAIFVSKTLLQLLIKVTSNKKQVTV